MPCRLIFISKPIKIKRHGIRPSLFIRSGGAAVKYTLAHATSNIYEVVRNIS